MKRTPKDVAEQKARAAKAVNDKIRRDWGAISPVTKVVPNKKKKDEEHPKYKEW